MLCKKLFVSGATVRRDLEDMAGKGLILRIRGGATLFDGRNQDAPLPLRSNTNIEKKQYIAQLALPYLIDYSTLFMDSSSTVTALAEKMKDLKGRSIITNGIATANVLNETSAKVFLCGGLIKNNSSLVGSSALNMIDQFYADILLFSCCGLSGDIGATEASEENAVIKRKMMQNSRKKIILCDSTKFDQKFFCKTCALSDVDVLITDRKPDNNFLSDLPSDCKVVF